ncbi:MAG TPA: FAD-linked oxidase C-terminal domain-containing protein [Polyangiaceae bacterium]|nr:FAD-linked oxidase C-terminal domain-containing protein [Polyangiaceae bacterium]
MSPGGGEGWVEALRFALGGCPVETDADVLAPYARDQAPFAPSGAPAALVRARSVDDVVAALRFADGRRVPVVTRAAGTGLAGGANAVDGCIVLSVAKLDRIVGVDAATRTAVVGPGVLNAALAAEAAAHGLFYAPDPASRDISTIGGNIATNAGGGCCLKYGVTGDHVAALKVVTADGTLIRTGSVAAKNVAGLDLTRLLVGSEGTLGVIVEATMRLLRPPPPAATLVAFFGALGAAADAVVAMMAEADLSLLEVMDGVTIRAVEAVTNMGLDVSAEAVLFAQSDAPDAAGVVARCEALCRAKGARDVARTDDPAEGRLLLAARRMALPSLERLGATLLDDVAVPRPALPAMVARVQEIAARRGVVIGTFGHAGDGNLHPTVVFDRDPAAKEAAYRAFDDILRAAIELGGTITGEHGVGSLKRDYVGAMVGEAERALMRRIKAAFDPNGILNPGKAF